MGDQNRVVVVGGGHNGLVAAILAAGQGFAVTLLERGGHVGGATQSAAVFKGQPVQVSRYSYLIALFPEALMRRLGITVPLLSRNVSSYTPLRRGGRSTGLLIERNPGSETRDSFRDVTGSDTDFTAWQQFYSEMADVARVVAPTLSGPLRRRGEVMKAVVAEAGEGIWQDVVERPIGEAIVRRFRDDAVRGIVATDALIGTYASLLADDLLANRCFLYHLIGRGTGEWLVPQGGMGALISALETRARQVGVTIVTGRTVCRVEESARTVTVESVDDDGGQHTQEARWLLAAVAPSVVQRWRGVPPDEPTGAQLKINMLLDRLPRLASGMDPAVGFAGTTHLEQGFRQLEDAHAQADAGRLPQLLPCEVYCHSLTDPSIMNGHPGATLTLFGLHTPVGVFRADADAKEHAARSALAALEAHLTEPLADCLARDEDGSLCLDVATPVDLENSLALPGGNIFHGDLTWPWAEDDEDLSHPADAYGVRVDGFARVLLAGAGTRRGGGVSGLGGEAAADAVAEIDRSARR